MFTIDAVKVEQLQPMAFATVKQQYKQEQALSELASAAVKVEVDTAKFEESEDRWAFYPPEEDDCDDLMKNGMFPCEFCPKTYFNRYKLAQHLLHHLKVDLIVPQMYQCDYCLVVFTQKNRLIGHITTTHNRRLNKNITKCRHKCDICNTTFNYKSWYEHIRSVHSSAKFECHTCSHTFKCRRYLVKHLQKHHDSRPKVEHRKTQPKVERSKVLCPECPKTFKNLDCLQHHTKNVHSSNGKKYVCELCGSALRSEVYLRAHIRRVHYDDGKLHECDICKKKFKSPRYLKVHKKNTHWKIKNKILFESPVKNIRMIRPVNRSVIKDAEKVARKESSEKIIMKGSPFKRTWKESPEKRPLKEVAVNIAVDTPDGHENDLLMDVDIGPVWQII